MLPSISAYVKRMLEVRQLNRDLKEKEEMLVQKLKERNRSHDSKLGTFHHHSFDSSRVIEGL
jgi:hypothetical protein